MKCSMGAISTARLTAHILVCYAVLLHTAALAAPDGKIATPDFSLYKRKSELLAAVETLVQHTPHMQLERRNETVDDYSASFQVVTVEPPGVKTTPDNKIRMLLDFGEHGRELITCEIGYRLLQLLAMPINDVLRTLQLSQHARDVLPRLLPHVLFKIVPMENESGRDEVERGSLCERKSGHGVDPNRNWDVHWGFKEPDYDPAEENPGKSPFSEPEARMLKALASEFVPDVWVNVHSGMQAIFMPFDHRDHIPDGEGAQAQLQMMRELNALVCGNNCAVGSGGKTVGYLAHGTATDYMFMKLGVPLAFTWEVYGDDHATYHDCFRMFNPITPAVFEETVVRWTTMVFELIARLPNHPSLQRFAVPLQQPQDESSRDVSQAAALDSSLQHADKEQNAKVGAARIGHASLSANVADLPTPGRGGRLLVTPQSSVVQATQRSIVVVLLLLSSVVVVFSYMARVRNRKRRRSMARMLI